MTTKKSVYHSDEMLSIWDSIPVDERGEVIRKALRDYANQSDDDPNLREIRKIEIELENVNLELVDPDLAADFKKIQSLQDNQNALETELLELLEEQEAME